MQPEQSEYLTVALNAVKQAEGVIRKYLEQGVRTELKADQSPVTIADKGGRPLSWRR